MPLSKLKFIKRSAEFQPLNQVTLIPPDTRGIYALLHEKGKNEYEVLYVGMSGADRAGIRGRLVEHGKKRKGLWTHFSIFEVWDNITQEEIRELEGILRHIYRKDPRAHQMNLQKSFQRLKNRKVRVRKMKDWLKVPPS